MNNFITIFNNIYNKFMDKYEDNLPKDSIKISSSEENYLNIIYSIKNITLTKFAEIAKVTKPGATQIINKYIKKGYVIKTISNTDKRVCHLEVSEHIKKHFEESYKKLNKFYNECLEFLSEDEFKQLNSLLLKINNNL